MDVGFTNPPAVTREMQRSYIDVALDGCAANPSYRWTTESLFAVVDWWQAASDLRRAQLLAAVEHGQIAIAALPLNNAPTLNRDEWVQMLQWVPADLRKQFHPSFAVQDDVNGFPRARAVQLLDHGTHRLFLGMNSDSGGPPFHRPTAFWWRMPVGRRLMVYLGDSYPMGYEYFHESDWRRGPVPSVGETHYRRPHAGGFFKTDEASLRQAQRICARNLLRDASTGFCVVNAAPLPYTGWVAIPTRAMRVEVSDIDHYEPGLLPWTRPQSPADPTPENDPAEFTDNQPKVTAKIRVESLAPNSAGELKGAPAVHDSPEVQKDSAGWPVSVRWKGMTRPLFAQGLGDFLAVRPGGFAPRWILDDMLQGKHGKVEFTETGHTLVYKQTFTHPRLKRGTRTLEAWKNEPRECVTISIKPPPSDDPESYYVAFPLPVKCVLPRLSEGGMPFTPFEEQIPGSCRDYFAFDGWAKHNTPAAEWLWVSRDAPLLTFNHPEIWVRRTTATPADRILAEVFNHFWHTNFVGNENGSMEFQFDLVWKPSIPDAQALADTLVSEPVVVQK